MEASHCPFANAECQVGKLWIPIFVVLGLTQPGIEPEFIVSVADSNHSTTTDRVESQPECHRVTKVKKYESKIV